MGDHPASAGVRARPADREPAPPQGNYGKPGAGISPIRGHSNVQGDRTVGIDEKPSQAYLDRVRDVFGFEPPREEGHHTVDSVEAMLAGTAKVFIGLGGNFVRAVPDTDRSYAAMRGLDLTVGIATKLNRGHLVHGRDALILPVVARSERIETAAGEQFVTIEDSMSNVTASRGVLDPASPHLLTETEIVCRMAMATLPQSKVDWASYIDDYSLIRDKIAAVYPALYEGFSERIKAPMGFHLDIPPRRRVWATPNGKANFLVLPGLAVNAPVVDPDMLRLATVRSHDQFNTTIYSYNDRYRGVYNDRMILFMNADDIAARGLEAGTKVALENDRHRRHRAARRGADDHRLSDVARLGRGLLSRAQPAAAARLLRQDQRPPGGEVDPGARRRGRGLTRRWPSANISRPSVSSSFRSCCSRRWARRSHRISIRAPPS